MNPGKIIGMAVGVFMALAGPAAFFYAGTWWENRPAGWPNYSVGPCPFCIHVRFPDGPGARLKDVQAAFVKERVAFNAAKAALDSQNRAVLALKTTADAWQARSVKAVQQASSGQAWRLALADQLRHLTLPADATSDAQCMAAEAVLRGAAR